MKSSSTNEKSYVFKKIDQEVFNSMDKLSASEFYLSVMNQIQSLPVDIKQILGKVAAVLIFFIPFLVVLFMFLGNQKIHQHIELKERILSVANEIVNIDHSFNQIKSKNLAKGNIDSKQAYENYVQKLLYGTNISLDKFRVSTYQKANLAGSVDKVSASIAFKEVTFSDFNNFIARLSLSTGTTVSGMKIKKDLKTNLLHGDLKIEHLTQGSSKK